MVETKDEPILITHLGEPVVKIAPYRKEKTFPLKALLGSVIKYEDPTEPVGLEDWEALK